MTHERDWARQDPRPKCLCSRTTDPGGVPVVHRLGDPGCAGDQRVRLRASEIAGVLGLLAMIGAGGLVVYVAITALGRAAG